MEKGLISIDRWGEESQAYFLSHLHADHTQGLSPKWSKGPLFCSPITKSLFPSKFPGFDLSLLRVLQVGSTTPLSLISSTSASTVTLIVTAIDAHHCPGAVMYLFRGEFGCVLYTGDFRWESTSKRAHLALKTLLEALDGDTVDNLYLDNTYCNPAFSFPPRNVAAKQIIDIIASHPDHEVIIGVDSLGKEDLLVQIAEALNMKIWVWPERLQTVHLLGFLDVFTTKTCLTRVRAVPRNNVTLKTLEELNTLHPTIGIMPSGLPWVEPSSVHGRNLGCCAITESNGIALAGPSKPIDTKRLHQNFYLVPYSDHSCFSEINEFVKAVRPSTVTGIVSSSICYINPRHYFRRHCEASHLSYTPCSNIKGETNREAEAKESRSNTRPRSSSKSKARGVKMKYTSSSIRRSRICILRQQKRGAKITDNYW